MRWLMLVALAACGSKDDGPSCDKVVDNMMAITKSAMPAGHDGMEMQNRKAMVDQCVARKMSADERRCLAAAKDVTGMAACTPKSAPK